MARRDSQVTQKGRNEDFLSNTENFGNERKDCCDIW